MGSLVVCGITMSQTVWMVRLWYFQELIFQLRNLFSKGCFSYGLVKDWLAKQVQSCSSSWPIWMTFFIMWHTHDTHLQLYDTFSPDTSPAWLPHFLPREDFFSWRSLLLCSHKFDLLLDIGIQMNEFCPSTFLINLCFVYRFCFVNTHCSWLKPSMHDIVKRKRNLLRTVWQFLQPWISF